VPHLAGGTDDAALEAVGGVHSIIGGTGVELRKSGYTGARMSELEKLEEQIQTLSPEELKEFREWFAEFDARAWDEQIEADSKAGRLDALVSEGIAEYKAGKTRKL
jgi:hypothetical protein